jgi:hypothetical protein
LKAGNVDQGKEIEHFGRVFQFGGRHYEEIFTMLRLMCLGEDFEVNVWKAA